MSNSILLDKSKDFALEVIRLSNEIKTNKKESILTMLQRAFVLFSQCVSPRGIPGWLRSYAVHTPGTSAVCRLGYGNKITQFDMIFNREFHLGIPPQ